MNTPLPPAARTLLVRLARSLGPWRALAAGSVDAPAMLELVGAGLVDVTRGVYRPTAAGRAVLDSR